jgi:hypothetical protein
MNRLIISLITLYLFLPVFAQETGKKANAFSIDELFLNEVPSRVSIGKETLKFEKTGHDYIARQGAFEAVLKVEPLATVSGKRWSMTITNKGDKQIDNINVVPLYQQIKIKDAAIDQPQVRHITGSNHYDGTYPPRAFRVFEERFMTNDHCKPLTYGGQSANDNVPLIQFAVKSGDEKVGFTAILEWSSSWSITAFWINSSFTGPPPSDFFISGDLELNNMSLNPGEQIEIPPVHLIYSKSKTWDGFSADLHKYILNEVTPQLKDAPSAHPVSYDHWFGIHEDFDVNEMKKQADRAAELGCEYFTVDCGWALNPWQGGIVPDPKKFPNGMEELSDYVRSKGMRFGIWNHIEAGKDMTKFQLPEVREYHTKALNGWVKDWNLQWMRLEGANLPKGKEGLIAQKAMKELYGGFLNENPGFYLEGCQGGGKRLDLNMARMSHGTWLSDHTGNPDVCRYNQTGALRAWPALYLDLAIRVHRNSGDKEAFGHNFLSRMPGVLSFNGDIAQWSPQAVALAKKHVAVFKQTRHLKDQAVFFPLPQPRNDNEWDAVVFGDGTGEAQLLFVFRMEGSDEQFIKIPETPGKWEFLLNNGNAKLKKVNGGYLVSLNKNSSALWIKRK